MDAPNQDELGRKIIENLMETFIVPAIARRQAAGELPKTLDLRAVQVVFFPDGRPHAVRVNGEIKGDVRVRLKDGIEKRPGETIFESEVAGLDSVSLLSEEVDCGHATLVRIGASWGLVFDFTYNKGVAAKHVAAAQEFLDTAQDCLERGRLLAFIDVLFSAASLAAKALFLSIPDPEILKKASHKSIHTRVNRWAHVGSLPEKHSDAFNTIHKARFDARYLKADVKLSADDCRSLLESVREMVARARNDVR